jgi:DNA-binding CsgD family transcriptional regulator
MGGSRRGAALTAAEVDVVARVLAGESNAEIARARRSTSRTVANLLARSYRKLGVASRRELAAKLTVGTCLRFPQLSIREQQVAALVALGHSNKLIAYELDLALSTIGGLLADLCKKLGVRTTVELVRILRAN